MNTLDTLQAFLDEAWDATVSLGFDPYPVEFYLVPSEAIYEISSYGIVNHWRHWTYGRDYWLQKERLESGYGRLYEMVINSNPAIAYLLDTNTVAAQKLVIPHVFFHSHVFKHNYLLNRVRTDMPIALSAMTELMDKYAMEYGGDKVEELLDAAMSISAQVDDVKHKSKSAVVERSEYADLLGDVINKKRRSYKDVRKERFDLPTTDLLGFIANNAPFLEEWECNVLKMVRDEALYFRPQMYTKILNEGAATFGHEKLLGELSFSDGELIEAIRMHAGVAANNGVNFNPYWFGWTLLKYIEKTHGLEKVLDVIETESDASLIRNWVNEEFVRENNLFTFTLRKTKEPSYSKSVTIVEGVVESTEWEVVRDHLANAVAIRPPVIIVEEVKRDYTLILQHEADGTMLKHDWAQQVLNYIKRLWGADVQLVDCGRVLRAI